MSCWLPPAGVRPGRLESRAPQGLKDPRAKFPPWMRKPLRPSQMPFRKREIEPTAPPKWEPAEYTKHFVRTAIDKYITEGLDATVAYYNTKESIDGQWYMVIYDQNDIMLAHAPIPVFVGLHSSETTGPNNFPAGNAVIAAADEDGAWFSYNFANPATGAVESKHSWMVSLDGLTFGAGWYEQGPAKHDAPAFTRAFVGSGP